MLKKKDFPESLASDETYVYYDGDILFSMVDRNRKFLVLEVDRDLHNTRYVVGQIDETVLGKFIAGQITLYEAFFTCEPLRLMVFGSSQKATSVMMISKAQLVQYLPNKRWRLTHDQEDSSS